MTGRKAQVEFAIIKGLAIALVVVGGLLIYETITAKTSEGITISCRWDCSEAKWSECANGYAYRDVSLCIPKDDRCLNSQPLPSSKAQCDNKLK